MKAGGERESSEGGRRRAEKRVYGGKMKSGKGEEWKEEKKTYRRNYTKYTCA
jgi:hypothetical protein